MKLINLTLTEQQAVYTVACLNLGFATLTGTGQVDTITTLFILMRAKGFSTTIPMEMMDTVRQIMKAVEQMQEVER